MKNHRGIIDHKLASQVMTAFEKGGGNENLARKILKEKDQAIPMLVAMARQTKLWWSSRPQTLINVQPDLSWGDICQRWKGRTQLSWRHSKDKKLREEKTQGGLYAVDTMILGLPEFFNKSLKSQLRQAKARNLEVTNAITSSLILLELEDSHVHLPGYSFRTSSKGKNGRSVEVTLGKNGLTISTLSMDKESSDTTGIFVVEKKMVTPSEVK